MIDFTDAPKLKKGYGGANGNKISIMLNGSRWMLKFPSSFSQLALALKILYWVRIL